MSAPRWLFGVWLGTWGCSGGPPARDDRGDPTGTPPDTGVTLPTDTDGTGVPPTFVERAAEAGFLVSDGAYVFADLSGCCDPDAYCWGNNPSTPYGMHALPGPPGRAPEPDILADLSTLPETLSHTFRLRADEAVVWLGTLPPRATYLGYSAYVADKAGTAFPVAGAVRPPTNAQTLTAQLGPDFWGQPVAIVTTLDAGVEAEVVGLLRAAGWDAAAIVTDRIPGPLARPGWDEGADTYMTLMRVALYEDETAGLAWQAAPGAAVHRLTPAVERPWTAPHPLPPVPPRGSGTDERPLRPALDALGEALGAWFAGREVVPFVTVPYFPETLDCVLSGASCAGNSHDRYAAVSPSFTMADDEWMVAFGVNHAAAGKATYSSASLQTVDTQLGLVSFTSDEMVGSARPFLPDHPDADALYAVAFARDCAGFPGECVEVPFGCPGAEARQPLKITARAYLEPSTGAAPVPDELLLDRVVKVQAR